MPSYENRRLALELAFKNKSGGDCSAILEDARAIERYLDEVPSASDPSSDRLAQIVGEYTAGNRSIAEALVALRTVLYEIKAKI